MKALIYFFKVLGAELSSGAVRNHNPEIMVKAFEVVGLGEAIRRCAYKISSLKND